jgi:uncharacterized protein
MRRTIELLKLLQVCGQIDGRKKLQKMVHILREAGHPFTFRYGYHFHGPFSAELKGEIDALVLEGLVSEQPVESGSGDYVQYTYRPEDTAEEILRSIGYSDSPRWAALARNLNERSAQELEAFSTVLFLKRNDASGLNIQDRFKQLKPHLVGHFEGAERFAHSLDSGA